MIYQDISLKRIDTKILSDFLNTSEVLYELGSALIFHMNKTFKQFIEGYKDPMKRELKLKGQKIIRDQEMYDKITTPLRGTVRVKKV